jgi:hypothetical protein
LPTIISQIDREEARLTASLPAPVLPTVCLYFEGLRSKFKEADYALRRIKDLGVINVQFMTSSEQVYYLTEDKLRFYVDAFFAFSYSALDVMSQIINQKFNFFADEKDVKFKQVVGTLATSTQNGTTLQQLCAGFRSTPEFTDLEAYRNCSTHRRHIYISLYQGPREHGSRAYPTTTTIPTGYWLIWDDPNVLNPTTRKRRKLISYCDKTHKLVRRKVLEILRSL